MRNKFLERIVAGRNPRARNRGDEFEPDLYPAYDDLFDNDRSHNAKDNEVYVERKKVVVQKVSKSLTPYVHLPKRKNKRSPIREVWYN